MGDDENQRKVFDFLIERLETKESFTKDDLVNQTTWRGQTPNTYWSKQYRPFLVDVGGERYRVSEAFRPYSSWDKFQLHVTQVRRLSSNNYVETNYEIVRVYEFFMPLSNESHLRVSLDALFYRDTVEARLRTIDTEELTKAFPPVPQEGEAAYLERLCSWISQHFGGYSIYHVSGRFRAMPLTTRKDVGTARYLVDETTAVTRFIFPCNDLAEAELVEFLFKNLFVRAIIEVVNGEDEIWMVETGLKNQLHIWRVTE